MPVVFRLALGAWIALLAAPAFPQGMAPDFSWHRKSDRFALMNGGAVVWQLHRDTAIGKAWFHPVSLIDGTPLTWQNPPDHVWHRGLWFEWKFIDGVNYWEDVPDKGQTEIVKFDADLRDDHSAEFRMTIHYKPPGGKPVMREERRLGVSRPDARGRYRIDWTGTFTSLAQELELARTPPADEPGGQSWGGYSGMSVRIAKKTRDWRIVDSEGRQGMQCHRQRARWIRGDFVHSEKGRAAGIAILDHPENPRHPTPSFVVMTARQPFIYYSPAPLFDAPLKLPVGEAMTLRYRVLVHPDRVESEVVESEWRTFAAARPKRGANRDKK